MLCLDMDERSKEIRNIICFFNKQNYDVTINEEWRIEEKAIHLIFQGDILIYNANGILETLQEIMEKIHKDENIVIDLQGVNYVCSTGLGTFIKLAKGAEDRQGNRTACPP